MLKKNVRLIYVGAMLLVFSCSKNNSDANTSPDSVAVASDNNEYLEVEDSNDSLISNDDADTIIPVQESNEEQAVVVKKEESVNQEMEITESLEPWQKELYNEGHEYYTNIRFYTAVSGIYQIAPYWYEDSFINDEKKNRKTLCTLSYLDDLILNDNGFLSFTWNDKEFYYIPNLLNPEVQEGGIKYKEFPAINLEKEYAREKILLPDLRNITCSSYLQENIKGESVSYDSECIEFYSPRQGIVLPWVEGVEGYGIGESIEFDAVNGYVIYILNGYVDLSKPELYKANSRIKKAKLNILYSNGEEEEKTVDFEDFVYCKKIKCNYRIKHAKLTIEEVYPSDRYDDTCITWIFTNSSFQM